MWNRSTAGLAVVIALATLPAPAHAQSEVMDHATEPRFSTGGELNLVLGPSDDRAFFNYTDYDRNALRIARMRFFGEWRLASDLSVIGELRTENLDAVMVPLAYLRWHPHLSHAFAIQAGRVPTVIGGFPRRAYSRDNAVLGLPLAYQYLTSLRPDALPGTIDDLLRMRGRGWQPSFPVGSAANAPGVSLVSVSHMDTGVEASWQPGPLDVAIALTRGSPAVPVVVESNRGLTWSSRIGGRLPGGVVAGVSAARGQWIDDDALALTSRGTAQPADQMITGVDAEFGTGRWLVRSEWLRSAFDVPLAASASTARVSAWSTYVEARYKLSPRWQAGTRVERLDFSKVTGTLFNRAPTPWDAPVERVETAVGFRITRQFEVRGAWQQNWREAGRVHRRGFPAFSAQYWF